MEKISLKVFLILLSFATLLPTAQAADRVLHCTIGRSEGTADIQVMAVENHPELLLFSLDMSVEIISRPGTKPASSSGIAHLSALLSASIDPNAGGLVASGEASSVDGTIINPEEVTLQGTLNPSGESFFNLYDGGKVLEFGFGIGLVCK